MYKKLAAQEGGLSYNISRMKGLKLNHYKFVVNECKAHMVR